MTANFNLFSIIILLGALQGLILGIALLFPGKHRRQNKYFLAAFMLMLVYDTFGTFCWSAGLTIKWLSFFDAVYPYTIIFTAGPSLYLYIQTTIHPERVSSRLILKTYLPAIIDFGFRTCLLVYALLYHQLHTGGIPPGDIDGIYQPVAEALMVMVFWFYLVAAIRGFKRYEPDLADADQSMIAEYQLVKKWTRILLIVMVLIAIAWSLTIVGSMLFRIEGLAYFAPIEIILVIFTYWIGLKGYQHTRVVFVQQQKANKIYADALPPEETIACIGLLKKAMEADKLYLDPALTVNKLAEKLNINSRTISAVLNRELKKGFSEFINEYRINEVKHRILQPENSHITIAGIAFECGFNSVATFQRSFKNSEQITPGQFLLKHKRSEKISAQNMI